MRRESVLHLESAGIVLEAELAVTEHAIGTIVIVDGGRRARHDHRQRDLAAHLHEYALSTLLVDAITLAESLLDPVKAWHRLDTGLLAGRIVAVVDWLAAQPETGALPVGVFAGGRRAGDPALLAAARRPSSVRALVCRDARPTMSAATLAQVTTPTLLIANPADRATVEANEHVARHVTGPCKLQLSMDDTNVAGDWFGEHLRPHGSW
ncbi:hypothetical protein [Allorhizocola rhizosphaerae]|uniref:hypothetical protein n=1 Tax=Allorhizocola rhizosphaerae TaxID=1872709 RepID=UPI0013C2BCB1|nr:hypothetical protein [Allorhizocola rhizosphaerae]